MNFWISLFVIILILTECEMSNKSCRAQTWKNVFEFVWDKTCYKEIKGVK